MENILPEQWKSARIRAVKQKVLRMINTVSSFYMLGVAEAGMLLQFPFLVREKGALIDRQSLSCISLPQVATGLRSRLPGSFRRRGFQPDLLMPQEALFAREAHSMQAAMRRALLRRGRSGNATFSKTESNVAGNLCRMCRKEESRHGDFSLHNQNSRTK